MKLIYVPLDERPCNFEYPQLIAQLQTNLQLVVPPRPLLSQKKQAAKIDDLWHWLIENVANCQIAILSIEMLVYGGLLPSRLHQDTVETLTERLCRIRQLKEGSPGLEILASNLIMRTPTYNSDEEEPHYYANYGEKIFRWGWLQDKEQRGKLTSNEKTELDLIGQELPENYLADYQARRARNIAVNLAVLTLVQESVISFVSIPQDDSAPFGFTAMDQQQVVSQVRDHRLQRQVHLYPGADEVGCTLLARAYSQRLTKAPNIYLLYSAVTSEQIVPLYEDRPLGESVKAHVLAAGAQIVSTPEAADIVLAVNTAGQVMHEAWNQKYKDITYSSFRNLRVFVAQIEQLIVGGNRVAIADVAFANGGETELIEMLDDAALWDNILAYAGWNTSCNTLGTVIATAILGWDSLDERAIAVNKIYHLLEDWAYQAVIRMEIVNHLLPKLGASYYDFNNQETVILETVAENILTLWHQTIRQSFSQWTIRELTVFSPWQRMFEMGLHLQITCKDNERPKG